MAPVLTKQVTSVNACVVERLISDSSACVLRPIEFFVAWSGVVTLAFSGFPQPLLSIKEKLSLEHSIPPEKPGSVWPKTSLGCLRDGKRLTPEQLRHVHRICKCVLGTGDSPPAPLGASGGALLLLE